MRVEDAGGAPPTIPFWLGEAPARTAELSRRVARPARGDRRAAARPRAGDRLAVPRRRASSPRRAPSSSSLRRRHRGRPRSACRRSTRSSPSASSTRPAACSSCSTRPSAARINRAWASRCASASASASTSSSRRPPPTTGSCSRSASSTASRSTTVFAMVRPQTLRGRPRAGGARIADVRQPLALERDARARAAAHPGRQASADARSSACAPRTCSRRCSRPSSPAATTTPRLHRAARPSAGERDARQLPPRGDGRRGPAQRARGDRSGAHPRRSRSRPRRRRRCRTRSSTPTPTRSSTTRRSRSAARARSRCDGRTPTWRAASARSTLRPSTRCGGRPGRRLRDADELHDALLTLVLASGARRRRLACAARGADRGRAGNVWRRAGSLACLRRRRARQLGARRAARPRHSRPRPVPLAHSAGSG